MAGRSNEPDFEDFLRRVDELESLVKGEAVIDAPQEGSICGPNVRQQQSPVNRTVINRAAFKDDPQKGNPGNVPSSLDQDAFMRSVQADANERALKRKKRKEEATVLKERGNEEFKKGNYPGAVELYTEGLERLKDFTVLYTNRAQAYNKLERFEEAIEDCQTALQLESSNVKARIHLGKAYLGLKKYNTAIKTYQEILNIDKKQDKIVKEYIAAAHLAESSAASVMEAERLFNEGDAKATGVVQILSKLRQPHQPIPYYAGGIRILGVALNDGTSRALFRKYSGFQLLTDNTVIKRCLEDALECDELMTDVNELVCVTLDLITAAITDNVENTSYLVNLSIAPSLVLGLLSKPSTEIQHRCVWLLFTLSQHAEGQSGIVTHFDIIKLLSMLVTIVETSKAVASDAAKLLNNLALNERFNAKFSYEADEHVLPAFEKLLVNYMTLDPSVLFTCVSMMSNMAQDKLIRTAMSTSAKFVNAIIPLMERYVKKQEEPLGRDILLALMGLLLNIYVEVSPNTPEILRERVLFPSERKSFIMLILPLLDSDMEEIRKRSMGLISNILPFSNEGLAEVAKVNHIPKIISVMKNGDQTCGHYGIKCLAVLTQKSEKARKDLVRTDQELKYIRELLNRDGQVFIGNAALVISHCTQVAGLSSSLVHTGIVKALLSKTDSLVGTVKQNCAIALAKLATTDQRHLDELRECGGIGILHSCMKHVK